MPPKKKIKIRAVRGARQTRAPTKKPSTKQIVNIYTTEPVRTDFRQQIPYIQQQQPVSNPFAPVFNIQQPQQRLQEDLRALRQEYFIQQEPVSPLPMDKVEPTVNKPVVSPVMITEPVSQENIPFARRRNAGETDEQYAVRIQKYEAMLERKRAKEKEQRQKAKAVGDVVQAEVVSAVPVLEKSGGGRFPEGPKFL